MPAPTAQLTPSDVIRLYGVFNRQLTQTVRGTTRAPRPVVEDACQVAWTALICAVQRVDPASVRAWLIRTAVREARRLVRLEAREAPLDRAFEERARHLQPATDEGLEELLARREQVHSVRLLSTRQQRLVWLRALGFSYDEIAAYEGATLRTVRRQLERAQRRLRSLEEADAYRAAA